jgi:hypothetical protein
MPLELRTGHEGANPQTSEHVERLGPAAFRVCPQSEDGDSNYKFALDVIAVNPSDAPAELALTVDWQEPPEVGTRYMNCRGSLFLGHGPQWREIAGRLDGDRVHFALPLPPGESRICLHPPFGTPQVEAFFTQASGLPRSSKVVFGRTQDDRPLEAAVFESADAQASCLLVVGRGHPYETAGSWCVAGVLDLLAGPDGERLRRKRRFVLVPMMNPDGVANGLCKRTPGGSDITHDGRTHNDLTARAVVGFVTGVLSAAPRAALWDVHGWMIREDGMNYSVPDRAERIIAAAGGEPFPNGWRNTQPADEQADPDTPNFRRYAARVLGAEVLVTSHPFFGRTPATMRQLGATVCRAFIESMDEAAR